MVDVTAYLLVILALISFGMLVMNRRYWFFPLLILASLVGFPVVSAFLNGFSDCRDQNIGYCAVVGCTVGVNFFAGHFYLAFRRYWKTDDPLSIKADYRD